MTYDDAAAAWLADSEQRLKLHWRSDVGYAVTFATDGDSASGPLPIGSDVSDALDLLDDMAPAEGLTFAEVRAVLTWLCLDEDAHALNCESLERFGQPGQFG